MWNTSRPLLSTHTYKKLKKTEEAPLLSPIITLTTNILLVLPYLFPQKSGTLHHYWSFSLSRDPKLPELGRISKRWCPLSAKTRANPVVWHHGFKINSLSKTTGGSCHINRRCHLGRIRAHKSQVTVFKRMANPCDTMLHLMSKTGKRITLLCNVNSGWHWAWNLGHPHWHDPLCTYIKYKYIVLQYIKYIKYIVLQ